MIETSLRLIDLYAYRKQGNDLSFLLLQRSRRKIYGGQWRMIGGKVKPKETYWQAALRELTEETGLAPHIFWSVPTLNHFYEAERDQIHLIPVFAAEIPADQEPSLDDEHDGYRWVSSDETDRYIYWPEQKRIIGSITEIITGGEILEDWIIEPDHI